MRISKFILAVGLMMVAGGSVQAKSVPPKNPWPELGVETRLFLGASFTSALGNNSAIRTFEPDGDDGLWIQDRQRRWYYAEILGPCTELNFAQAIGFDNRGSAYLDKFARIIVRGQRCAIASFVTAAEPLSKKERKAVAKERRATAKAAKAAQ